MFLVVFSKPFWVVAEVRYLSLYDSPGGPAFPLDLLLLLDDALVDDWLRIRDEAAEAAGAHASASKQTAASADVRRAIVQVFR